MRKSLVDRMSKKKIIGICLSIIGLLIVLETIAIKVKTLGPISLLIFWLGGVASPWLNTHQIVTEGEAYGFRIGMEKNEVLQIIRDKYKNVFQISYELPNGNMAFEALNLDSNHFGVLMDSNEWKLMYKEKPKWFVLEFEDNNLTVINYFHQRVELP